MKFLVEGIVVVNTCDLLCVVVSFINRLQVQIALKPSAFFQAFFCDTDSKINEWFKLYTVHKVMLEPYEAYYFTLLSTQHNILVCFNRFFHFFRELGRFAWL